MRSISFPLSTSALAAIFYYGAVATVLAYLFWTNAVGKVSCAMAGASSAAMPVATVFLSALILGESLETRQLFGRGAVAMGILLADVPSRRQPG